MAQQEAVLPGAGGGKVLDSHQEEEEGEEEGDPRRTQRVSVQHDAPETVEDPSGGTALAEDASGQAECCRPGGADAQGSNRLWVRRGGAGRGQWVGDHRRGPEEAARRAKGRKVVGRTTEQNWRARGGLLQTPRWSGRFLALARASAGSTVPSALGNLLSPFTQQTDSQVGAEREADPGLLDWSLCSSDHPSRRPERGPRPRMAAESEATERRAESLQPARRGRFSG